MSELEEFEELLTASDKEFINKQNLGGKMEPSYNKVQYSEFTPDRVGQWVLRGDTIEEVLAMKKELFGIAKPLTPAETPQAPVVAPVAQNDGDGMTSKCKECGAVATFKEGVAKSTGKPWKGWFCTASREHKPFFIK